MPPSRSLRVAAVSGLRRRSLAFSAARGRDETIGVPSSCGRNCLGAARRPPPAATRAATSCRRSAACSASRRPRCPRCSRGSAAACSSSATSMSRQHTWRSCALRDAGLCEHDWPTTTPSRPRPATVRPRRRRGVVRQGAAPLPAPVAPACARAPETTQAGLSMPPSSRSTCRRPCCRTASRGSPAAARTGSSRGSRRARARRSSAAASTSTMPGLPRASLRALLAWARAREAAAGAQGRLLWRELRRALCGRPLRPGGLARQPLALHPPTAARVRGRRARGRRLRAALERRQQMARDERGRRSCFLSLARGRARAGGEEGAAREGRPPSDYAAPQITTSTWHCATKPSQHHGATRTARTFACRRRQCGTERWRYTASSRLLLMLAVRAVAGFLGSSTARPGRRTNPAFRLSRACWPAIRYRMPGPSPRAALDPPVALRAR